MRRASSRWWALGVGIAAVTGGVLFRAGVESSGEGFEARIVTAVPSSVRSDEGESVYTVLFVGDIMLARGVASVIERQGDVFYPFQRIADEIRDADFAFGNLENPISNRGRDQGSIYSFRARPQVVQALAFAGFDALSLANNHIWDYGRDALEDTIAMLTAYNVQPVGAGMDYSDANGPKFFTLSDGTRLVLFAYTNLMPRTLEATATKSGLSQFDVDLVADRIRALRTTAMLEHSGRGADIIAVSLHWGEEYAARASGEQRAIAHALVDAGADLVVGHHPHVVQEVEAYASAADRDRVGYIAYSLGNFIFDQDFSRETMEGLLLEVAVRDGKIQSVAEIPVRINESFQPKLVSVD